MLEVVTTSITPTNLLVLKVISLHQISLDFLLLKIGCLLIFCDDYILNTSLWLACLFSLGVAHYTFRLHLLPCLVMFLNERSGDGNKQC